MPDEMFAALKQAGNAAIGLHLTLTAPFKPLTRAFTPLAQGAFHPLQAMLRLAHRDVSRRRGRAVDRQRESDERYDQ